MIRSIFIVLSQLICICAISQSLIPIKTDFNAHFRGLSVVNNKIIWLSGTKGTIARSTNGGKSFTQLPVPGYENRDFRDIEAFDTKTAIIMAIDTPAVILKTTDGGQTWKKVYEDKRPGMFLDAMEFWNELSGIVIGDPIDGKIFIARTFDGGDTWRGLPEENYPVANEGESFFAASGTNISKRNKEEAVFVTGGLVSRLFIRDQKIELPFEKGSNTCGANAVAVNKNEDIIVVGGDYKDPVKRKNNCFIIRKKNNEILSPEIPPFGYRSCVLFCSTNKLIACGSSGVDISEDGGVTWKNISTEGYHVVKKAKKGKAVYLAGPQGKIARFSW